MAWDASTWIDLASAVGSLTAAVVALWLGLEANRKSKEDAKSRAGLYAASIVVQLSHTADVVSDCATSIMFDNLTVALDRSNAQALESLQKKLAGNLYEPDQETLVNLVALNNNCASRIASAFDTLKLVRNKLNGMPRNFLQAQGSYIEHRQKLLDGIRADLLHVQSLLLVALPECVKASALATPIPSGVEMYGIPED